MKKECDCCGYPAIIVEIYRHKVDGVDHDFEFCKVCSETCLSHASIFPGRISDPGLYRSIAYAANMILDEIRKRK